MRREEGGLGGGLFLGVAVGLLYFSSTGWIWGLNFFFAGEGDVFSRSCGFGT
jgi:hypothetical protein